MSEIRVGTRELKNQLSHYLRRVKAGETIIVTEHGKPIGQIMPVKSDLKTHVQALAEAGLVEWNGQQVKPYQPKAANLSKKQLSDLVAEDRE